MPELLAIAYPDEIRADRAGAEIERCAEELAIDRDAAAVVICERDDSCQLTTSRHPGATAHWSQFWGAVLEGILNGGPASAVQPGFRDSLRGLLRPGTSALLVAVSPGSREGLLEALRPRGGTVLRCDLAVDAIERWDGGGRPC